MSRTDVLVDPDRVDAPLTDAGGAEVDEDVATYVTGHLVGAARLDWATELQQSGIRDVSCTGDGSHAWSH